MGKKDGKKRSNREKKKFEVGASTNYISRNQALKRLQLSLKDFRRLCILKGIHPHEPKHKKKVNKGSTELKTWYYAKDVQFLAHEPIINKFRDYKVFLKRLKKAKAKRERDDLERIFATKPKYSLDHIVRERYPSFVDAVRDLDDALCLCFLFARLPKSPKVNCEMIELCRRLTAEFMHFVIASNALRKVFVSIKGIYYQAEIDNETVTWIVPHERGHADVTDVDWAVMATFVEFYVEMLGFVNYKLYSNIGLFYPPKLQKESEDDDPESNKESVYSLAQNIMQTVKETIEDTTVQADEFPIEDMDDIDRARKERQSIERLKTLFSKCKFFLGREVPRQSLTLIIRACGGRVSWDSSLAYGSTYAENDETITHQIADRPNCPKQHLSRIYIQPQWVFDCINVRQILPSEDYFPGVTLPPHLSPFVAEKPGDYVPPERFTQMQQQGQDISEFLPEEKADEPPLKKKKLEKEAPDPKMSVSAGKSHRQNEQKLKNEAGEQLKLREMMIPKKQRRVYQKIKKGKKRAANKVKELETKRKDIDSRRAVEAD